MSTLTREAYAVAPVERLVRLHAVCRRAVADYRAGDAGEAMEDLADLIDELFAPPPRAETLGTDSLDD